MTTRAAAGRPRAADVAFGLALTAAACAVVFAAMLPFQIGATVDRSRQAAAARQLSTASLQDTLTGLAIAAIVIAVLFAAAVVLAAFRLRAGRRRARILLVVLTVLALAPLNVTGLLVCGVLIVADVFAFQRPVTEWLRGAELQRARARG